MAPTKRPPTIRNIDDRNLPVVLVPVDDRGDRWAIMEAADFDALPDKLKTSPWFMNSNGRGRSYVKAASARSPGNLVTVSRMLLGAKAQEVVRYATDKLTDLRRSNISLGLRG